MSEPLGQEEAIEIVMEEVKKEISVCPVMRGVRPISDCNVEECDYYRICHRIRKVAEMTPEQLERETLGNK